MGVKVALPGRVRRVRFAPRDTQNGRGPPTCSIAASCSAASCFAASCFFRIVSSRRTGPASPRRNPPILGLRHRALEQARTRTSATVSLRNWVSILSCPILCLFAAGHRPPELWKNAAGQKAPAGKMRAGDRREGTVFGFPPEPVQKLIFLILSFIRSASRRTRASNFASISQRVSRFPRSVRCTARQRLSRRRGILTEVGIFR